MPQKFGSWIFLILIITACVLTIVSLFITSGNYLLTHDPKAIDFLAFYTGAKLVLQSPYQLYNLHPQLLLQQQILPLTKSLGIFIPFLNPPFLAVFFIPFILFDPTTAYDLWLGINGIFVMFFCYLAYKQLQNIQLVHKSIFIILTVTFIPVLTSLLLGQLSILLCLILFLSWLLLQKKKLFLSGLLFSFLLIKPHFLIVPLLAFLIQRQKKFLAGFLLGISSLLLVSFLIIGWNGMMAYLSLLENVTSWTTNYRIDLMAQHSLQTILLIIFQTTNLANIRISWVLLSAFIIIPTVYVWKTIHPLDSEQTALQWSLLILATLLTSPHTHFHDLTLLLIVGFLVMKYFKKFNAKEKKRYFFLLITGYIIELTGYLFDIWTKTQSSHFWISIDVFYLLLFWFSILRHLLSYKKETPKRI